MTELPSFVGVSRNSMMPVLLEVVKAVMYRTELERQRLQEPDRPQTITKLRDMISQELTDSLEITSREDKEARAKLVTQCGAGLATLRKLRNYIMEEQYSEVLAMLKKARDEERAFMKLAHKAVVPFLTDKLTPELVRRRRFAFSANFLLLTSFIAILEAREYSEPAP